MAFLKKIAAFSTVSMIPALAGPGQSMCGGCKVKDSALTLVKAKSIVSKARYLCNGCIHNRELCEWNKGNGRCPNKGDHLFFGQVGFGHCGKHAKRHQKEEEAKVARQKAQKKQHQKEEEARVARQKAQEERQRIAEENKRIAAEKQRQADAARQRIEGENIAKQKRFNAQIAEGNWDRNCFKFLLGRQDPTVSSERKFNTYAHNRYYVVMTRDGRIGCVGGNNRATTIMVHKFQQEATVKWVEEPLARSDDMKRVEAWPVDKFGAQPVCDTIELAKREVVTLTSLNAAKLLEVVVQSCIHQGAKSSFGFFDSEINKSKEIVLDRLKADDHHEVMVSLNSDGKRSFNIQESIKGENLKLLSSKSDDITASFSEFDLHILINGIEKRVQRKHLDAHSVRAKSVKPELTVLVSSAASLRTAATPAHEMPRGRVVSRGSVVKLMKVSAVDLKADIAQRRISVAFCRDGNVTSVKIAKELDSLDIKEKILEKHALDSFLGGEILSIDGEKVLGLAKERFGCLKGDLVVEFELKE